MPSPSEFPKHLAQDEAQAIDALIDRIFAAGYAIQVRDFEDFDEVFVKPTTDRAAIQKETAATGGTIYDLFRQGQWIGSIYMIHGNGGDDIVHDCTDLPEILELVDDTE